MKSRSLDRAGGRQIKNTARKGHLPRESLINPVELALVGVLRDPFFFAEPQKDRVEATTTSLETSSREKKDLQATSRDSRASEA